MPSNIINLNLELEAREGSRALTPKQVLIIELRNHHIQEVRLRRSVKLHKVAYKKCLMDYVKVVECIERKEEKLLNT